MNHTARGPAGTLSVSGDGTPQAATVEGWLHDGPPGRINLVSGNGLPSISLSSPLDGRDPGEQSWGAETLRAADLLCGEDIRVLAFSQHAWVPVVQDRHEP